ncbi:sensor histidine kinase [Chitinophaga sp. Cy-1792]|uniref:sensor histidine kinase n=1 Tax=Chitinophaga sp. Cy-1792 TaxID=2608339 RepID=UPI0014231275|nr:histidine kinase [Chitinophaga sp. Cy-1792]NIG55532.1 hypothetical protein [Chitinophaga sp. Cy-1792]
MSRSEVKEFLGLMLLFMLVLYGMNFLTMAVFTKESFRYLHIRIGILGFVNFFQFYIYYRWGAQLLLVQKSWKKFLQLVIPVMLAFNLLKYLLAFFVFKKEMLYQGYRFDTISKVRIQLYNSFPSFFMDNTWTALVILIAALSLQLFIRWLREDQRRAQLEQRRQQAESGFLKMQLNSHFLINSLNSIYSLALAGSPEVVTANKTLTHLLGYMVEQPNGIDYRCSIYEEMDYLCDFIKLQRLRTGMPEGIQVHFDRQMPDKHIAPMLLVPFVENAFKHGITNQAANPVTISISGDNQQMNFTVFNIKSRYNKDKTGGIGLENVRRRLELIYPGQHQLDIIEQTNSYQISLNIQW